MALVKDKWYWAIGCGAIAISYMALNYARFGNITEFGHNYLPEFTRTTTGQFNLSYLKENLMHYLRLPATGETVVRFRFSHRMEWRFG